MADPLGTYYSPRESGLATVLGPSPNLAGIGERAFAGAQRVQMMREKQRQKAIDDAWKVLSKPYKTDQFFQPELDRKAREAREAISGMIKVGNTSGAISAASEFGQDLSSYAESATQLMEHVHGIKDWNKGLKHDIFNTGEIIKGVSEMLIGENGEKVDPRDIDISRLNQDDLVLKKEGGSKFLNRKAVIDNILSSDALKEAYTERVSLGDIKSQGHRLVGADKSTEAIKAPPWMDVSTDGKFTIKDGKKLIEEGLMNVFQDDPSFARMLEDDVDSYINTVGQIPGLGTGVGPDVFESMPGISKKDLSVDFLNEMRANFTSDMLEGRQHGGTYFRDREEKLLRSIGGGSGNKKMTTAQQEFVGTDRWTKKFYSGDVNQVKEALEFTKAKGDHSYLMPQGELKHNEKVQRVETTGNGLIFTISKLNSSGNPKTKDGVPDVRIYSVPINDIDLESARNYYQIAAKLSKRNFGMNEEGEAISDTPPVEEPIKIVLPNRK